MIQTQCRETFIIACNLLWACEHRKSDEYWWPLVIPECFLALRHIGVRDTTSRSSRLFKKLHEARYHREKNSEGKGPGQKVAGGKGASGTTGGSCGGSGSGAATCSFTGTGGVDQIFSCEVSTLCEGPSSEMPGPSKPVIKVKLFCNIKCGLVPVLIKSSFAAL